MAKFIIEAHRYAPELNRVIFKNGESLRAPNVTSIKQARALLFAPCKSGVLISVEKRYPRADIQASCGKKVRGFYPTLRAAFNDYKKLRAQWVERSGAGLPLFDGSIMPAPAISARISLRG